MMFDIPSLNISVSAFLIVYGVFMLFYITYSLFNVFHLLKYGFYNFGLYILVTLFTGGTVILIAGSAFLLLEYNWDHPINVNDTVEYYNEDLFPGL